MKDRTMIIIKVCALIIVFGFISNFFSGIMNFSVFNVSYGASTNKQIEEEKELKPFQSILLSVDSSDVELIEVSASEGYKIELIYFENCKTNVTQKGDILEVMSEPVKKFYLNKPFGINTNIKDVTGSVKIYYPSGTKFKNLSLQNDMGNISVSPIEAESFTAVSDYGMININGLKAENTTLQLDSGHADLKEIYVKDITIEDDYGNVTIYNQDKDFKFDSLDIGMDSGKLNLKNINSILLSIRSDYGDVDLSNIYAESSAISMDSGKLKMDNVEGVFEVDSDYGEIDGKNLNLTDLEASADSGNIKLQGKLLGHTQLEADYGSVTLTLDQADSYGYDLYTDYGDITVKGKKVESRSDSDLEKQYHLEGNNKVTISCESGNIDIK